ncbi:rhamnose transport system substrate-binding protein [Bacillus sp. OV166]|uniref:autoinducer 2 ABC transporter substrate-binding protein n=1 Tax=Bacillus sp. OV166 TaxID=1882763 RepID=UPI000A2AD213|nr:autoinducer 2 ABC transporter substrate-binding protein [Bacillus sp. OV166]SMQ63447.1 rhamnose transport system substrate-binding protein [Bacillus sp. OV166]
MLYRLPIGILLLFFVSGCSFGSIHSASYEVIYNGGSKQQEQDNKSDKNASYTIAIVPKVRGIPYFNAVKEGAMEAGKDLGVNVLYIGPPIADWEQQEKIIEGLIQKHVNVIAVAANDPHKLGPVLQKAQNQGIKVITWDSDTDREFRELFINMVDSEILGRHIMDTLASRIHEEGRYAIMTGSSTAANLNEWIKWVKIQQKEYYPKMELIDIVATDEDSSKAYMVATKLLKNDPELRGIIAISTVNPPAAAQAVKDTRKTGKVIVVGSSTPNLMRPYLEEETAQVVTLWSPQKLGYLTVSLANNLLENNRPFDGQRISNIGNVRVNGDTVIMGQPIDFTKENIDQYDF